MTHALGIDSQTIFGMLPTQHIALAAHLGCSFVSLGIQSVPWKLDRYPQWSLRDDPVLRRDTAAQLRALGISISLAEGFVIRPGSDVRDKAGDLDILAELGAKMASTVAMDRDMPRALDQLAALAEMTGERQMKAVLEFAPPHAVNSLESAIKALHECQAQNIGLVIDAMHFFRSGSDLETLRGLDPNLVAYAQLCDVPLRGAGGDYLAEASFERLAPGDGELPLQALVAALPRDVGIGIELPMQSRMETDEQFEQALTHALNQTRNLLEATN
ncbi:TIM barrel protein [Novosphingobium sp. ST904]|uniref:sugar phosphate isomerase/epimerase family protein n=1 Tax=Novosphingobium sp. ST904 TaxID=1684385 RepID=UPI0006C8CC2F|nr:TIM barrel protein [Novosphingobium sp. ST904]KPH68114.1 hypothetical protein ADT71_01660 [Novosphingobium sp. ST904]TCM23707.1 sugar phosphate isomerase/epimerase [Novosphingobium sp. ST904]